MHGAQKVNRQNLKQLCWQRGMSVAEAARRIGRQRPTLHRAAADPSRFGPTIKALTKLLFP